MVHNRRISLRIACAEQCTQFVNNKNYFLFDRFMLFFCRFYLIVGFLLPFPREEHILCVCANNDLGDILHNHRRFSQIASMRRFTFFLLMLLLLQMSLHNTLHYLFTAETKLKRYEILCKQYCQQTTIHIIMSCKLRFNIRYHVETFMVKICILVLVVAIG